RGGCPFGHSGDGRTSGNLVCQDRQSAEQENGTGETAAPGEGLSPARRDLPGSPDRRRTHDARLHRSRSRRALLNPGPGTSFRPAGERGEVTKERIIAVL